MEEIIDGVIHWKALRPHIDTEVDCHFVTDSKTAIDPLPPDEGIEWFDGPGVERVVLSTRHHLRHAPQLAERFGRPIHHGAVGFVSDGLIGDEPEEVKRHIRKRCEALLTEKFEHLLFAHGDPLLGSGLEALRGVVRGR
jgi:hypothetical protein